MRVLVTGGAGFIGSHVVDALVAEGDDVCVLDSLIDSAHDGMPDYVNPAADLVQADLRDAGAVRRCVNGFDAVCHQASMVGLEPSFRDAPDYVAHNDLGTAVLLGALEEAGFAGRLVLASSMVVYGEGHYRCEQHGSVPAPPRSPALLQAGRFEVVCPRCGADLEPDFVTESRPTDPRNVYAATKVHQEHLCGLFARTRGIPLTILRYHNVYGARMPANSPYSGVAAIFRSALERGERPRVFEDGAQLRDFVSAEDVARANAIVLHASSPPAGVFNIATGQPHSVGEMANLLASFMEGMAPVVTGEWRVGDVRHVFASPERAQAAFGWTARVDFNEGIRRFAAQELRPVASAVTA